MNEFKLDDPVIIIETPFENAEGLTGIISQVEKHPTLSTMYRVVDNDGQPLGRFYHHQLELNKELIRDYKIKQIFNKLTIK